MRTAQVFIVVLVFSFTSSAAVQAQDPIAWLADIQTAKSEAARTNKPILVHFWSPSCLPCLKLEQDVYSRPGVKQAMERLFVLVRLNAVDYPATAAQLGVTSWPADVILAPDGQFVTKLQCPPAPQQYVSQLDFVARGVTSTSTLASADPAANRPGAAANTMFDRAQQTSGISQAPFGGAASPQQQAASAVQPSASSPAGSKIATYNWGNANDGPPSDAGPGSMASPLAVQSYPTAAGSAPLQSQVQSISPTALQTGVASYGQPIAGAPQPANFYSQGPAPSSFVDSSSGRPEIQQPTATAYGQQPPPQYQMVPASQAPPLALDGYCPVQLYKVRLYGRGDPRFKFTKGDPRYGVIHRGRTYLFSNPEAQQEFLREPDRYSPAMAGVDPVLVIDEGQYVAGSRDFGLYVGDRVYLFASEQSRNKFSSNMRRYIDGVYLAENPGRVLR